MQTLLRWIIIALLASIYVATLFAVLHPHVSPAYKAYYIDLASSDWDPVHYDSSPEQGITFSRKGLPDWVASTRGLSIRDDWGRWTDSDLGTVAGLAFTQAFNGPLCLDFTVRSVSSMVGKTFAVRMGNETKILQVATTDLNEYRVQFTHVRDANKLDVVLPGELPPAVPKTDQRRLGLNLATMRLIPGTCAAVASPSVTR